MKTPVRVAVTGAAGQIGYSLLFRIAAGEMLGRDQPVILQLLELPIDKAQAALQGRDDGARGLRVPAARRHDRHRRSRRSRSRTPTIALLVGARPRGPGMERKDLLLENAKIFIEQGKALDAVASRDVKVLVVGNPANTNAYIAMKSAPSLPKKNFTAMLRLDHNRALSQLAAKTGKPVGAIEKLIVWGNHSPTMYADYRFATVGGQSLKDADQRRELEPQRVPADGRQARRGDHRGARPVVGRVRRQRRDRPRARLDARQQRQVGHDGRAVGRQLRHSRRTSCTAFRSPRPAASTRASRDLPIDDFSREKMNATLKELEEERAGVAALLG